MVKRLNLNNINEKALPILKDIEENSVNTLNNISSISMIIEDLKNHYITTNNAIEHIEKILHTYEY